MARSVSFVVVAALVAAGCAGRGDDAPPTAASEAASPTEADGPVAEAVRIDAGVDVALADAAFEAVEAPVPVAVGDVVRTDATGFAEVTWFEGSVARLDVDTVLEVVALVDVADTAEVRTRMDVGRTWHRVVDGVAGRTYEVETRVATATVRGTTFVVDCPTEDECTFTVVEGSVEVTPIGGEPVILEAPTAVTVSSDGVEEGVSVVPPGEDPWLAENLERDGIDPSDVVVAVPDDSTSGRGGEATGAVDDTRDLDAVCSSAQEWVTSVADGTASGAWFGYFPVMSGEWLVPAAIVELVEAADGPEEPGLADAVLVECATAGWGGDVELVG